MRFWGFYVKGFTLSLAVMSGFLLVTPPAEAKTHAPQKQLSAVGNVRHASIGTRQTGTRLAGLGGKRVTGTVRNARFGYARSGGLQCVPFARAASGIALKGNAANWWDAAVGVYERGGRPEPGSVLNFRSTGRMRLGHVAVVMNVVNPRQVEVDQANWPGAGGRTSGGISRGVPVIDVSAENDWSAVRVGLGSNGGYGSVYATYGFIYDRPDTGVMVASTPGRVPTSADLQSTPAAFTEVAEAPAPDQGGSAVSPVRARNISRHPVRLHVVKRRHR